jgi:hypothetical protein
VGDIEGETYDARAVAIVELKTWHRLRWMIQTNESVVCPCVLTDSIFVLQAIDKHRPKFAISTITQLHCSFGSL